MIAMLPTYLEGVAKRYFKTHELSIVSWELAEDILKEKFQSVRTNIFVLEQQLADCQQGSDSVYQYYCKILDLCLKVDPLMTESRQMAKFISGLNEQIKESLKYPSSLDDALAQAQFVSRDNRKQWNSGRRSSEIGLKTTIKCFNCGKMGHKMATCRLPVNTKANTKLTTNGKYIPKHLVNSINNSDNSYSPHSIFVLVDS